MIIGGENKGARMGNALPNPVTITAAQIADQLGETDATPRRQIWRIVRTIGPERTQAFVEQALEIEANGGMLLPDGSRKRTLGGVFFRLVRDHVSEAERRTIWPYPTWQQRKQRGKGPAPPAPHSCPPSSGSRQMTSWQRFLNIQERQPL